MYIVENKFTLYCRVIHYHYLYDILKHNGNGMSRVSNIRLRIQDKTYLHVTFF